MWDIYLFESEVYLWGGGVDFGGTATEGGGGGSQKRLGTTVLDGLYLENSRKAELL